MSRKHPIETVSYRPPLRYALDLEVMPVDELRRRVPVSDRYRVHRIEFHMLVFVTRGRFTHMVDFEALRCSRGVVLALRPGQVQRFERAPDWDGWIVMFRPEFLLPLGTPGGEADTGPAGLPTLERVDAGSLEAAVEGVGRMHRDAAALPPGPATAALLRHQLYALLLRLALGHADRAPPLPGSAASLQRFRRFQAAVERDFVREHGVSGYARRLGCSERSLTRATLECAGTSAKAYLVNRIILEAKRLLAHTAEPVASIADRLGFGEATNFVKFFRRESGCSPGEFRRRQASAGTA